MLKEEIVVGRAYVSERACIVREVTKEVDRSHVRYQAFQLDTGRLLPSRHRVCSKLEFRQWADRQARPDEKQRIHPFESASSDEDAARAVSLSPEDARAAADAAPGLHTFPRVK